MGVGGLPWWSDGKVSACNAGDPGFDPWVGNILWRREWLPTPVFLPRESHGQRILPRESHGQRSLVGYSPWVTESWTYREAWTDPRDTNEAEVKDLRSIAG